MKKTYIEPEMEIVEFETEDIMATSGISFFDGLSSWDDWGTQGDW